MEDKMPKKNRPKRVLKTGSPNHGPKRGPGRGRPPMGPQLSPEAIAIMPDYIQSRKTFFMLDCLLVVTVFLIDLIKTIYFCVNGSIEPPETKQLILTLIIPATLNGIILLLAQILRSRLPKENGVMPQNIIPIIAMLGIAMVVTMSHYTVFACLALFCLPICMTAMFNFKNLCSAITIISVVWSFAVTIRHFFAMPTLEEQIQALSGSLILILIIYGTRIVTLSLIRMTEKQKGKLLKFASESKEAHTRAEAANMAKSAFLANMSHEIRTPINAILGMNEMILRETENEQIMEYATSIHSASESLLYLINDVLDISKIESGKLDLVETTYETASFIHDCYNMVSERAHKKGLEFSITCNPLIPSRMKGDEARLRQVISNLLTNAVKYTKEGNVTMSVDKEGDIDNFVFVVTVRDTGIGIKEENMEQLFSHFTRFDLERNRNIEGTGLGLAITKQLVDLMKGELFVESEYGKGSVFILKVPQVVISHTPVGDFHKRFHDIARDHSRYRQSFEAPDARILVVDDVAVNLRVISNLLKKTRINVDTAENGKQCLSLVTKHLYDIIFMDHMMPEMDGIETYEKMKQIPDCINKNTPVIMLTANAIAGVGDQYLQTGFSGYLSKPVRSEKLEKIIMEYLPDKKIQLISENKDIKDEENKDDARTPDISIDLGAESESAKVKGNPDNTSDTAKVTAQSDSSTDAAKVTSQPDSSTDAAKVTSQSDSAPDATKVTAQSGSSPDAAKATAQSGSSPDATRVNTDSFDTKHSSSDMHGTDGSEEYLEEIGFNTRSETDNLISLQNLYQSYPSADLNLGLSYCGQNMDIYLTVLQTYGENDKTNDLKSFYEKEDLENYRILVHGIKSSSLNVGFSALSEKAKLLESASAENDWNFISEHHAEFFEEYKNAVESINKWL